MYPLLDYFANLLISMSLLRHLLAVEKSSNLFHVDEKLFGPFEKRNRHTPSRTVCVHFCVHELPSAQTGNYTPEGVGQHVVRQRHVGAVPGSHYGHAKQVCADQEARVPLPGCVRGEKAGTVLADHQHAEKRKQRPGRDCPRHFAPRAFFAVRQRVRSADRVFHKRSVCRHRRVRAENGGSLRARLRALRAPETSAVQTRVGPVARRAPERVAGAAGVGTLRHADGEGRRHLPRESGPRKQPARSGLRAAAVAEVHAGRRRGVVRTDGQFGRPPQRAVGRRLRVHAFSVFASSDRVHKLPQRHLRAGERSRHGFFEERLQPNCVRFSVVGAGTDLQRLVARRTLARLLAAELGRSCCFPTEVPGSFGLCR